jgi:hypothetical protein
MKKAIERRTKMTTAISTNIHIMITLAGDVVHSADS